MTRLDALLARMAKTVPAGWDLGIDRMHRVLSRLGDPHLAIPSPIHIAGTNGKGSTTAFLRAILEASGRRVHVYTSPHLVRFAERIRLAGTLAEDNGLAEAIERAEAANAGEPITFFELTTLAAFLLFAEHPADVTLLEVGLGGRLDATNVVRDRLVSVITPISIDHEKFLGSTLTAIAAEKAGIIERGRPVVSSPQADEVVEVLDRAAAQAGMRLSLGGRDWTVDTYQDRLIYQSERGHHIVSKPALDGPHQLINAATAIAALEAAGFDLADDVIDAGLCDVSWPARMQRLVRGPLTDRAPPRARIRLDGGHNPGAGEAIAATLREEDARNARLGGYVGTWIIAGLLETKDPIGFFGPLVPLAHHILTVPIADGEHAGRDPEALAALLRDRFGVRASAATGIGDALDRIRAETRLFPPRILICGSLYLAGEVLRENGMTPT